MVIFLGLVFISENFSHDSKCRFKGMWVVFFVQSHTSPLCIFLFWRFQVSSDLGECLYGILTFALASIICFTVMYTFLQFGEYEFHVSMTKVSCSGQVIQHNSKAVDVLSAILIKYHACVV